MKKINTYLFAVSISLLSLTACSNDDVMTVDPMPTSELEGKWKLNTMSVKSYENGELVDESTDVSVDGQIIWEYEFKEDFTIDYYMAIPAAQLEERGTGTYSKKGNSLTITIDAEPAVFVVSKIDLNNLHLKMTEEEEYEGIKYKDEIEQKFIKK